MCISKNLSLVSFITAIFSSIALILFGDQKYILQNKTIGYFMMFVGLMQLVDYSIWSDLDCISGLNKLGAIVGPILNHIQPLVLTAIIYYYLDSNGIIPTSLLVALGIIYGIYMIYKYREYLNEDLCIKTNVLGGLDWKWKHGYNYILYHSLFLAILLNFYKYWQILIYFVVSYILFNLSITGEIWCFLITGLPLINLIIQSIFPF
jgi:hypothetical protein